MTPERWAQIEELFHRAAEHDVAQRAALLDQACGSDAELRQEVEGLLSCAAGGGAHVQAAIRFAAYDFGFSLAGAIVSHYRILEGLDGGGMGLVYRAEDIKLGRRVALKFLPEESANDPAALARFEREARAASALEHPNICPIYEFGEHEGQPFLVMQLLEGQTLRQLLETNGSRSDANAATSCGPRLSLKQALHIAIQIASGLEAAHLKGIVHRDIKPANIFVTSEGRVKLLDFGLAKLLGDATAPDDEPEAEPNRQLQRVPVPELFLSRTGVALGTAAYMSPEQARGEKLDARTDLFSFGLVLQEMATGRHRAKLDTTAVLRGALGSIPVVASPSLSTIPARLQKIINKALESDLEARYQTAAEMRADLELVQREIAPQALTRRRSVVVATAVILLLAVSAGFWFIRRPASASVSRPELKLRQLTFTSVEDRVSSGAISPNGKYLAYAGFNGIYIENVETGQARAIAPPAEFNSRSVQWDIIGWSPDNDRFVANAHRAAQERDLWTSQDTSVWVFSAQDGTPVKIREKAFAYSISPDGSLISFGTNPGKTVIPDLASGHDEIGDREIWTMDPNGGHAQQRYATDENSALVGTGWSPHGERLIYASIDESGATLLTRDLNGGPPTVVFSPAEMEKMGDVHWLSDGRLIYSMTEAGKPCSLWETRLDPRSGKLTDTSRQLTNWSGPCLENISETANGSKLVFLKRSGHLTSYMGDLQGSRLRNVRHFPMTESSDGVTGWTANSKSILLVSNRTGRFGVYVQPLDENVAEPLVTEDYGRDPVLTPDGKWLLYLGKTAAVPATAPEPVMRVPIGGGPSQQLFTARTRALMFCARPPSQLCAIAEPNEDRTQAIVSSLDPLTGRGPELMRFPIDPSSNDWWFALSADGTRIAATRAAASPLSIYSLNGLLRQQLQVKGWPNLRAFAWAADGNGLFIVAGTRGGRAVLHVNLAGSTHLLWENAGGSGETWAVPSPDGRRLAMQGWTTSANMWMMEDF